MTALRAEGCGIALRAISIKSALRDWLSVSYGMIGILVISRYAAPSYPAAPDFLHGKACHTILRSLCSLTNRVPLPPHPGDRINRSMLSCRDMAPLLSTHSAPACGGGKGTGFMGSPATRESSDMLPTGQGGGASHQRGIAFPRPSGRLYGFSCRRKAAFILAPIKAPTTTLAPEARQTSAP